MEKYTKEQLEKRLDELFEQNELSQDDFEIIENANSIADNEKYDWRFEVSCYMPRLPDWFDVDRGRCLRCGKQFVFQKYSVENNKIAEICIVLRNKGFDTRVDYYCDDCIKESGGKKGQLRYKKDGATDWDTIELDDETIDQLLHDDEQDNNGDDK